MAKIIIKFQDRTLNEVALDKEIVTIGRKPGNTLQIDNLAVSGFHAKIVREAGQFVIEDMGSLNGTFLNGTKVSRQVLRNGDVILVGKHILLFDAPEQGEAAPARAAKVDETLVLDSRLQQKLLGDVHAPAVSAKAEAIGGFSVIAGASDILDYELWERVTTIGKSPDSGIRLKGFFAPKVAALVSRRREGYFINPAGYAEVRVNGKRIANRHDLKDGDVIEVHRMKLQFYLKD